MDKAISRIEGEPERLQNSGGAWFWTVPDGYKFPSCPTCGHKYWESKPERSIGGASVRGSICQWCSKELDQQ